MSLSITKFWTSINSAWPRLAQQFFSLAHLAELISGPSQARGLRSPCIRLVSISYHFWNRKSPAGHKSDSHKQHHNNWRDLYPNHGEMWAQPRANRENAPSMRWMNCCNVHIWSFIWNKMDRKNVNVRHAAVFCSAGDKYQRVEAIMLNDNTQLTNELTAKNENMFVQVSKLGVLRGKGNIMVT